MHRVQVKPVYSVEDFCNNFSLGKSKFYEEIRLGRLKAFKIGDRTVIAGEDAMLWRDRYRRNHRDHDPQPPAAAA
jgi:hypothetical protein